VREGALVGALDIPMFVPVQMISGATTSPSPSSGASGICVSRRRGNGGD
jgi:hypothetical protein